GFVHADETPFFWLGDTVWSAPSRATEEEWKEYITYRSSQGFNLIQVNALEQHDSSGDNEQRSPFEETDGIWDMERINPLYFRQLDKTVEAALKVGIYTAMVVLWSSLVPETNPMWDVEKRNLFTADYAAAYAGYLAARYSAYGVIW
ncbi:MAG TPA: hypothetical protein DIW17_09810, partial [Clostridiales bacterium]|nr:hypothetical protein [Clostridiales bacterium]